MEDSFWEERIMGVMLYGSYARGEETARSDIDLCIVAPQVPDFKRADLWLRFLSRLRDDRYDVRIFEILPLYMKIAVIEEGIVVHSRDTPELYEYFYPFRRDWGDQKHRQETSREEMGQMLNRPRQKRADRRSKGS